MKSNLEGTILKVHELINRLQVFDPDAEVYLQCGSRSFVPSVWVGIVDIAGIFDEEKDLQLMISPWEPEEYLRAESDEQKARRDTLARRSVDQNDSSEQPRKEARMSMRCTTKGARDEAGLRLFEDLADERGMDPQVQPDFRDEAVRRRLGPAGWKAFRRLMGIWKVSDDDSLRLLALGPETNLDHLDPAQLGEHELERISCLIGIHKALRILYSGALADQWVQRPNTNAMFDSQTPLAYMICGGLDALRNVRRLLDARCAGNW